MMEQRPLDPPDRELLNSKAQRARAALRTCAGLAVAVPVVLGVFLAFTPTAFTAGTVALALVPCLVLALPLLAKCYDLSRTVRRVDGWLDQGHKIVLTDPVTQVGPHFMVTVGGTGFAAWEKSRQLAVGDEVTVEYLPLDGHLDGIVGVLSIDGEPNPYFESPWRSGPPTA